MTYRAIGERYSITSSAVRLIVEMAKYRKRLGVMGDLSPRALRALLNSGADLNNLRTINLDELENVKNCGKVTIQEIRNFCAKHHG